LELRGFGLSAGGAEQLFVFVEGEAPVVRAGRAPGARSGHPRQPAPKVTVRGVVIGRVNPFGQVTVASSLMVKSSWVDPPGTAGRSGIGLITAK
jgi:hypothetical protein